MIIRQIITEARKQQGLTQKDLALRVGIRHSTVSDFETGKKAMRSDLLEKIMEVLHLDIVPGEQNGL